MSVGIPCVFDLLFCILAVLPHEIYRKIILKKSTKLLKPKTVINQVGGRVWLETVQIPTLYGILSLIQISVGVHVAAMKTNFSCHAHHMITLFRAEKIRNL